MYRKPTPPSAKHVFAHKCCQAQHKLIYGVRTAIPKCHLLV